MTAIEVTRDAPVMPQAPVDTSVHIPESVKRAAALANSFYEQPPAPADAPAQPAAAPAAAAPAQDQPAPAATPEPSPAPAQVQPATPDQQPDSPSEPPNYEHMYKSMKGRFEQSQQTMGLMQDQMNQMGDELLRTQSILRQGGAAPDNPQPLQPVKLLTDKDLENYGPELIDVVQRAATEAVAPELQRLQGENDQLKQRLQRNQQTSVNIELDRVVPNWREINNDQRFKQWLRIRDVYLGGVRGKLMNDAYRAADAARVVSFFEAFLREEAATGHVPQPQPQPQAQEPAPARQPVVPIETLTAPGRARPASGDTPIAVDKPIFTRLQISKFYSDVRAGRYAGRDAEKNSTEQQIFAAQKEGRIR